MIYKTTDGKDRLLPGIGLTVNGKIETSIKIENPRFVLVTEEEATAAPVATEEQPKPSPKTNEQTANKESA